MTVAELRDELDNYGDHLEVVVLGPRENDTRRPIDEVSGRDTPEGTVVEIGWS